MGPITMAGETAEDIKQFEAYQQLLRLASSYEDIAGTVPQLAVVGIESHGKSSLVQAYVGFPCTFIGQGTATRCPVEYTLTHDDKCDDPMVEFAPPHSIGSTIPASQLEAALGAHMRSLGDGFSPQAVRVRVRSRDCVNIVLLDLPGIIINPAEGKEADKVKVDEIVQFYATQPSNFLILVEKAVPSANSEALPKEMKRLVEHIRPNWRKECLMVATMFDQQIKGGNLSTMEDAITFYKSSQHPNQPRKHYVSLLPRPAGDRDAIGHIRRQKDLEQHLTNEWLLGIAPTARAGEVFPPEFKAQVGLDNARAAIQDKFYDLISTSGAFSRLRQMLREKKDHLEVEVKARRQLLEGIMKPGNLRYNVDKLSRMFLAQIHSLFQYTNSMRKSFDNKVLDFFSEIENRSSERLRDEDRAPLPFEPEWRRRLQSLREEDELIDSELLAGLLGSTQIKRATVVFKALILASEHEDWSDPGLQKRVFGHLAGSPSTKINYDKGIRELVKGGVTDNLTESSALSWFFDHLEWILRHNGVLVMEHILSSHEFSELKDTQVPGTILDHYRNGVKELVQEIRGLFKKLAWMKSQYVAHMRIDELEVVLNAIPRATQQNSQDNKVSGETSQNNNPQLEANNPPRKTTVENNDFDDDADEFEDSPPPAQKSSGKPQIVQQNGNAAKNFTAASYNSQQGGPQSKGIVENSKGAGLEEYFVKGVNLPPPRSGLPGNVISKICNRKYEGTPAWVTPSQVCSWVREAYFFNIIELLRELDFLVNSMVVLEVNGDVDRQRSIDNAITKVLLSSEEELDHLRQFNRAEVQAKQDQEEALLEKITADHKIATHAIAILERP